MTFEKASRGRMAAAQTAAAMDDSGPPGTLWAPVRRRISGHLFGRQVRFCHQRRFFSRPSNLSKVPVSSIGANCANFWSFNFRPTDCARSGHAVTKADCSAPSAKIGRPACAADLRRVRFQAAGHLLRLPGTSEGFSAARGAPMVGGRRASARQGALVALRRRDVRR